MVDNWFGDPGVQPGGCPEAIAQSVQAVAVVTVEMGGGRGYDCSNAGLFH